MKFMLTTVAVALAISSCALKREIDVLPAEVGQFDNNSIETMGASSISVSQRYQVKAKNIDQTYYIDVAMPFTFNRFKKLPVVYVLDGNLNFPLAASISRYLHQSGELPPMIVVGVGYAPDISAPVNRNRDLTPSVDVEWARNARNARFPHNLPEGIEPGGAKAFGEFLKQQVMPLIAETYPVDSSDQTLVGHSLGGLFALNLLLTEPTLFQRYVIGSPSAWWDERFIFALEENFSSENSDLNARVFMSVGGREDSPQMRTTIRDLNLQLRQRDYAGLVLDYYEFPSETHFSVIPAVLSRGLKSVFSDFQSLAPRAALRWPDNLDSLVMPSTSKVEAILPAIDFDFSTSNTNSPIADLQGVWSGGICRDGVTNVKAAIFNIDDAGATIEYARGSQNLGLYNQRLRATWRDDTLTAALPDGALLHFVPQKSGMGLKFMWRTNRNYCVGVLYRNTCEEEECND